MAVFGRGIGRGNHGGNLREKVLEEAEKPDNQGFSTSVVVDWVAQMAMALQYIHSKGIVHRVTDILCRHEDRGVGAAAHDCSG